MVQASTLHSGFPEAEVASRGENQPSPMPPQEPKVLCKGDEKGGVNGGPQAMTRGQNLPGGVGHWCEGDMPCPLMLGSQACSLPCPSQQQVPTPNPSLSMKHVLGTQGLPD